MFSRLSVSPQGDLVLQNRVDRTLGRETLVWHNDSCSLFCPNKQISALHKY